MIMLDISMVGDPVLRQRARELTSDEIRSSSIQDLIEQMRETMRGAPGVGLAAPQIGMALQLAVIEDRLEYHERISESELVLRERRPIPFHVIINPKIRVLSEPGVSFFEGCLSLPGFAAIVPRSRSVLVDCLDHSGAPVRFEAQGWHARILQHEIDHLHGTIYIDRMLSRSFTSIENCKRYWEGKSLQEIQEKLITPGTAHRF